MQKIKFLGRNFVCSVHLQALPLNSSSRTTSSNLEKKEKGESAAANKDSLKLIYGDASASGETRPVIFDSDRKITNKFNNNRIRWSEDALQAKILMLSPPEYKQLKEKEKEKGDLQQKKIRKNLEEELSFGTSVTTSPSVLLVSESRSMPNQAGEAEQVDIEALLPKLRHSDYYTRPHIQELAAKEKAEPGFCRHVKDFVVGRRGFGCIKFFGETDVRRLDLESLVQFNNCKGMVYADERKKPPVGQGLNKPAEVTLLNIKCFKKRTGQQHTKGPSIEKYTEMLKRRAKDQGAEFVSYDPVKGEWKFRVDHFNEF